MRCDTQQALSAAIAAMVRTSDGRAIRHVVSRLQSDLNSERTSAATMAALVLACKRVADGIAQRPPAAATPAGPARRAQQRGQA